MWGQGTHRLAGRHEALHRAQARQAGHVRERGTYRRGQISTILGYYLCFKIVGRVTDLSNIILYQLHELCDPRLQCYTC